MVLVVEDDDDVRDALCSLLEAEGLRAVGAPDGAAALSYLDGAIVLPGLILLDLMMAGGDGWSFTEGVQQDEVLRDIPIVVMTGASIVAADVPWAREILTKPISVEIIAAVLERYL